MTTVGKFCDTSSSDGTCGRGRPRGTGPTSATPRAPRSKMTEPTRPPTTSTRAPGTFGSAKRSPRMTASATSPTSSVVRLRSPRPRAHDANSCHAFTPSDEVPVSLGSSPITTSMAAPARKPVTTARDRKLASQPSLRTATSRNRAPVTIAIAATSCAASSPASPVTRTAPPATAASDELGPVEMCRDVQKIAVDDRRGGRRVQPVLDRDAGDAGVSEVLRNDHRRDGDARDQVAAEPSAVVAVAPSQGSGRTVTIEAEMSTAVQHPSVEVSHFGDRHDAGNRRPCHICCRCSRATLRAGHVWYGIRLSDLPERTGVRSAR